MITKTKHKQLALLCAVLSNANRIAVLEKLASETSCKKKDYTEIEGLSKLSVAMNLKCLKKYGFVNGSLKTNKLSYCIDYKKLDEFKTLFDDFYHIIMAQRTYDQVDSVCKNLKPYTTWEQQKQKNLP